jgi:hypothetical protein
LRLLAISRQLRLKKMQFEIARQPAYKGRTQQIKQHYKRFAMANSEQQERRRHENRGLSILVDLGVTYRRTLGESVAWAYFRANDIAPVVAQRVMSSDCERRMTDWECQAAQLARLREHRLAAAIG